jgi:hypothetical protein
MQTLAAQVPFFFLRGCWARLKEAARPAAPHRRRRRAPQAIASPVSAIDPVALTILAVNRLGPATFRTVWQGTSVTVTVPDRTTGEIFRAALQEMQRTRATDRLIRIEIAAEPARPSAAAAA